MTRSITRWTTALAAAAMLAVPATGWAQTGTTTGPAQPPATTETTQQDANSPQEHLRQAKAALNGIDSTAVTAPAKARLAELQRHMSALERATAANDKASATGSANRSPRATQPRGANWGTEVTAISKILNELIGTEGTAGTTGDPTAATGTSGTTGSASTGGKAAAAVTLDEATRSKLAEVRVHITAYAAAMSGTQASPSEPPTSATATGATTGATGTTGTTMGATGTTGTTGSMTGTSATETASATAQPAAQGDEEAARRHLTEARETLSQLTQLPAAAQLTGDARTQVSQLITNFNTLITAQSNWRESYAKLEANLNALLGPETADEPSRTATTSTATGTAGAVGTSGTAAATIELDATIRAKLVELRQKLNAFERAAGGGAAVSGETSMTTGTSTTGTSSATTATSGTATATSGTTTTGAEQQTAQPAQKTEAMGHSEAMRHIEAIEAILKVTPEPATSATGTSATGTSGTSATAASNLTLDRAQLDQLKMHLTELRKLLNQAEKK